VRERAQILELYEAQRGQGCVLGTVVDVRGSSYRRAGARILLTQAGQRRGTISGGCLEKDLARQAWACTQSGPQVVSYDTRGDQIHPYGAYGSGCEGVVRLLLERLPSPTPRVDPLEALRGAQRERRAASMATLYGSGGALTPGWRALWGGDTLRTDPDAPVDPRGALQTALQNALRDHSPPSSLIIEADGVELCFLIEVLAPPPRVYLFGAGDDAQPLARLCAAMGWEVGVFDRRPEKISRDRFPGAARRTCAAPEQALRRLDVDPCTFAVLMTHNIEDDGALLAGLLRTSVPWIGLLGPRRRAMRLMHMLAQRAQLPDPAQLRRVQSPVGLDLGGDSPEEVALSILAGLQAARRGRPGGLLRAQEGPIHPEQPRRRGDTP
jgi:xanthine/CO dehydrogenase XdhC/CoxF family maturation factor